jgi:1-acyl-sn-glycerol-3-phosphate acyltransferase
METKEEVKKEKKKKKKSRPITVKANRKGKHIMGFFNFLRVLVIPVYYLLKPFRIYGKKQVDGACVYVCNHYTMFDMVYAAATTWEGIHIIAKKELFSAFGVGCLARGIKAISANRDGNDVRALLDSFKCLKNGEKVLIFPEGTRNKTSADMLPFKHGAAMMAIRAKVPIIPMVIYNRPKLFRMTHFLIGEPLELTEYYDRKLTEEEMAQADNLIRDYMLEMRRKHTEYLESKKRKGK